MAFPHILTPDSLTLFLEGDVIPVDRTVDNWDQIKEALKGDPNNPDDVAQLRRVVSPRTFIEQAVEEHAAEAETHPELPKVDIQIKGGKVYFDGYVVNNELTRRLLDALNEGFDLDSWIKFAQNLYQNPLETAREEIFDFLSKCNLPLTPDGHFLAYKKVRSDYKDGYSGTIDNSPGRVVEMPREQVDTNRYNTCSVGLHFCSQSYLPSFGVGNANKVVVVKINPADVVSIPVDYSNAKGRTWRYEVVGEIAESDTATKQWKPIDSFSKPVETDENGIPEGMVECDYCGGTGLLSETIEADNMDPADIDTENDECSQCGGGGYVDPESDDDELEIDEDEDDEDDDDDEAEVTHPRASTSPTIHDPGPFGWTGGFPSQPID